jgi:replicative DNA helicase
MPQKNEVIYNRSVPYNTEAEIYVLGSVFIDNKIIDGLIGKLVEDDFYEPRHTMIYRAMVNLRNNGNKIEILSVVEELKRLNYADVANISNYLVEIVDSVPSTASVSLYIEIVEEKAEKNEHKENHQHKNKKAEPAQGLEIVDAAPENAEEQQKKGDFKKSHKNKKFNGKRK